MANMCNQFRATKMQICRWFVLSGTQYCAGFMVLKQKILFGTPIWFVRLRIPERLFQAVRFCPLLDDLTIYN
jgi:hypothetical protein